MAKARGSGNRNPNPNPDDDPDDDPDDPPGNSGFNDQQRDELRRMINAATSTHLGRKLDSAIKGALEGALAPLQERLEKIGGGAAGGDDKEKAKGAAGGGAGAGPREKDPEVDAMRKELNTMREERARERAESTARDRDTQIREHLTKIGVDPNRMRGAIAVLRDSLKRDESTGDWVYKAQRDGWSEDLDLGAGVKEWGETDEGKSYRAAVSATDKGKQRVQQTGAVNVVGRGAGAGGGQQASGGKQAAAQQQAEARDVKVKRNTDALEKLAGAVTTLVGGANVDVG